ncbi:MAG: ATP-binding protein [Candidatus Methanoperedens sp.]|nr:ATP-binding protein [Candidatus Methanoperedens sp.]
MININLLSNLNPWWRDGGEIEKDENVKEYLRKKHLLKIELEPRNMLMVGPRQVGKTTSLKLKIHDLIKNGTNPKNIFFFSCELLSKKEDIIEALQEFDRLADGKKYIFLDEITFVKDWQNAVKFLLDSPISREKVIYITGSSIAGLKKEMFPGRDIEIRKFLPLSFREFCCLFGRDDLKGHIGKQNTIFLPDVYYSLIPFADELATLFEKYLLSGGFPPSMYGLMENGEIAERIFDTYFNWVVSDMAKLDRSERIFTSIIHGIIKNYGSKFSLNSIAKEMEIGSHVTVRDYLELLDELYVARSFFQRKRERPAFRSDRKAYFIDPFLFRVFYKKYSGTHEVPYEIISHVVEGIVGEHLKRKFEDVFFFSGKKEIDFILQDAGIEVKYGHATEMDFPRYEVRTKMVLSKTDFKTTGEVMIIPVCIFLAAL